MRAALGLGPNVSDAAVVNAYVAALGFGGSPATPVQPSNPWAVASRALFCMPGSSAATYRQAGRQTGNAIRAIRTTAEVDMQIGDKLVLAGSTMIQLQRSQVAAPVAGDVVDDGDSFVIIGRPKLDVEQLTWNCEAEPA